MSTPLSALVCPQTDPTPIFELFRGSYATELLTAAVAHFGVFRHFLAGPIADQVLAKAAIGASIVALKIKGESTKALLDIVV